jgi:hypothetical protein
MDWALLRSPSPAHKQFFWAIASIECPASECPLFCEGRARTLVRSPDQGSAGVLDRLSNSKEVARSRVWIERGEPEGGEVHGRCSPGHHAAADAGCLYGLHTQHDPRRASRLTWRAGCGDNGLLGALEPIDLLTRPEPKLAKAQQIAVKKVARELLRKLERCESGATGNRPAAVLHEIRVTLNELPEEPYPQALWDQKVERVREFVFDRYHGPQQPGAVLH